MPVKVQPQACIILSLSKREIQKILDRVLSFIGLEDMNLDLVLTEDKEIAALNQRFMGCTGPTNVLSFPVDSQEGSIVVSAEAVDREALLYGQPVQEHFLRLLSHGVLHLAGFEHGTMMDELIEQAVVKLSNPKY